MLALLLCSLITFFPDYLYRTRIQRKSLTIYTFWYELKWGISSCLVLSVALLTLLVYFHPSSANAGTVFRALAMMPEGGGRVDQIYIENNQLVKAGDPLFSLLDSTQAAAVSSARSKIAQIDSAIEQAKAQRQAAEASLKQAQSALEQSQSELSKKQRIIEKDQKLISDLEMERLASRVEGNAAAVDAATANIAAATAQIEKVLPSQRESAQRALEQSEVELGKTVIYAGVDGRVSQFFLQKGDMVNPALRPAGVLIPSHGPESGSNSVVAGFNQLAADVLYEGMIAEASCLSKPFTVTPMVVTRIVPVIAAGQLKPSDTLIDAKDRFQPGTVTVTLEPLYENGMDGILPGAKCVVTAYTSSATAPDAADSPFVHGVANGVAIIAAVMLRIQTLMLPVQLLVFG